MRSEINFLTEISREMGNIINLPKVQLMIQSRIDILFSNSLESKNNSDKIKSNLINKKIGEIVSAHWQTDSVPLYLHRALEINRSNSKYIKILKTGEVCDRLKKVDELLEKARLEISDGDKDIEEIFDKFKEVYWVECNSDGEHAFSLSEENEKSTTTFEKDYFERMWETIDKKNIDKKKR